MANEQNGNALTNTSLLDLSTEQKPRPFITVDKINYELRVMDEFSLPDQLVMGRLSKQIDQLQDPNAEPDQKAESRISQTLDSVFCRIVINGNEIADKLSARKKLDVFNAFFEHQNQKKEDAPKPSTNSLEDSSVSSEEVPATG